MTLDQFRSSPVMVAAMRSLLHSDTGQPTVLAQAIVAVQSENLALDAKDDEPEIVSVRRLSRVSERQQVITELLSCAEPLPAAPTEEQPTWGVNPEEFKLTPQQ